MVGLNDIILAAALGFASAMVLIWPLRALLRANLRCYRLFGYDKAQAEAGGPRVPEVELLRAARWGGWIGAKLAQRRFRHKTRKEPFRTQLNRIGKWQAVLVPAVALAVVLAPPLPQMGHFTLALEGLIAQNAVQAATDSLAPARSLRPHSRPNPPKS